MLLRLQQLASETPRLAFFFGWQRCPKDSSNYQSSVLYFLRTDHISEERDSTMRSSVASRGFVTSYPFPQHVAASVSLAPGKSGGVKDVIIST